MSQVPNLYYSWLGTKHLKVMELHKRYGVLDPGRDETNPQLGCHVWLRYAQATLSG